MQKTLIIIPCHNEEKRLKTRSFTEFIEKNPEIGFVFVNDGSNDKTLQVLEGIEELSKKNVRIISYDINQGKAEAIRHAINHCLEKFEFDYIGYFDADLSTPLSSIVEFNNLLIDNNYELIAGSRIRRMGALISRSNFRHIAGRVFATFASFLLQIPIYDTQCGAKLFSKQIAQETFNTEFKSQWFFDVELFARLILKRGYKETLSIIYEHPLIKWENQSGSKISLSDYLIMPIHMTILYYNYFRIIKQKKLKDSF
jgi:glycosyltransferase involved in cell wall biosynthesis